MKLEIRLLLTVVAGLLLLPLPAMAKWEGWDYDFDEEKKPWAEIQSKIPAYPKQPNLIEFEAGRFSENEVQAVFHVGVVNPNNFQVSLLGLDYSVQLSGKEVSKGTLGAGERVSQASTGVFDITATLNEETHGKEAAKIVKGLIIPYVLKSSLRAELYTEELESKGEIKLKGSK